MVSGGKKATLQGSELQVRSCFADAAVIVRRVIETGRWALI